MLRGLTITYNSMRDEQVDSEVESVVESFNGEHIGSGCWLSGEPERDIQAEFGNELDAKRAQKAVLKINDGEYCRLEGIKVKAKLYDADEEEE